MASKSSTEVKLLVESIEEGMPTPLVGF